MADVGWRGWWKSWFTWAPPVALAFSETLTTALGVSVKWRLIIYLVQMSSLIILLLWYLRRISQEEGRKLLPITQQERRSQEVSRKELTKSFYELDPELYYKRRTTVEESSYMLHPKLIKRRGKVGHKITGKSEQPMKSAIQMVPMLESPLLFENSDDSSLSSGGAEEYQLELSGDFGFSSIGAEEYQQVVANFRALKDHINDYSNDTIRSDFVFIHTLEKKMEAMTFIQISDIGEDFLEGRCCDQSTIVLGTFNLTNDSLEFYFENGESMAKLVGVGLPYAKVIVKRGIIFEVQEVQPNDWKEVWLGAKKCSNKLFTIMQVSLPTGSSGREQPKDGGHIASSSSSSSTKQGFLGDTFATSDGELEVPCIWELAKFFIMKQVNDVFQNKYNADGTNFKEDYQKDGNYSTIMTWVDTLKVLFSKGTGKANDNNGANKSQEKDQGGGGGGNGDGNGGGGGGNGDGNGGGGDFLGENSKADDAEEYFTQVNVLLLSGGHFFERNMQPLSNRLPLSIERLDKVKITPELTFGFCKSRKSKKIQVTTQAIFALDRDCDSIDTYGHFGWFHDQMHVSFGPLDRNIHGDVHLKIDFKEKESVPGKMTFTASASKETTKSKGEGYQGRLDVGSSQVARLRLGASMNQEESFTNHQSNEQALQSQIIQTYGGFNIKPLPVTDEALLEYEYFAPYFKIRTDQIQDQRYRYELNSHPMCNLQKAKFVGTWIPVGSNEVVEYIFKADRRLYEISTRTEECSASTSSGFMALFKKPNTQARATFFLEDPITQVYEKQLYVNHAMAHLIDRQTYTLVESSMPQNPYQDLDKPLVTFPVLVDYQTPNSKLSRILP